ncbi:MAG TPA: methyltransferase domain-containing protein [Gaiellaceae bacterium]|nr:methyltransferase domain-containing protein [Gaiellaceae bacterium]
MSDDRYRYSFETVAEQYERARPLYADAAVAWVAERLGIGPGVPVLDLAAGTGKLTRQLAALGADVVAVEPGDEMRGVLERVVPQARALAGVAEAIPLADGAVHAVTVGQAFHWFDQPVALREIHRVLRPGGGVALLWNVWDENDPLLAAIDGLLLPLRPPAAREADWREGWNLELFGPLEQRSFFQRRRMGAGALVEWAGSTSGVVNAPREEQERIEREIRRLAVGHDGVVSVGTEAFVARRR